MRNRHLIFLRRRVVVSSRVFDGGVHTPMYQDSPSHSSPISPNSAATFRCCSAPAALFLPVQLDGEVLFRA